MGATMAGLIGDRHPLEIVDPTPERIKQVLKDHDLGGIIADPSDRSLVDADTPPDVVVTTQPRRPVPIADANLRIKVDLPKLEGTPRHRLVALGDSLTHGFHHLAIYDTDLSYPALIAYELGSYDRFSRPRYENEIGGLPLNLEYLARRFDAAGVGRDTLVGAEVIAQSYQYAHDVANVWEQSQRRAPQHQWMVNNLAVFGWNVSDLLTKTAKQYRSSLVQGSPIQTQSETQAHTNLLQHLIQVGWAELKAKTAVGKILNLFQNAHALAALNVLNPSGSPKFDEMTALDQATALGDEGTVEAPGRGEGIETLIVWIGSNNVLGSVISLNLNWTKGLLPDSLTAYPGDATVWRPTDFAKVFACLVERVKAVKARHVVWATVPHVTIPPLARGVGSRPADSRYYEFYVKPWDDQPSGIWPYDRLTAKNCRAIDSTVDQYNWVIEDAVRTARGEGRDWLLLDVAGFLDVLATRRYERGLLGPALPGWWSELAPLFQLPMHMVEQVGFEPSTLFFGYDQASGTYRGGIFGLDGLHATTIGYGAIAQRFIDVLQAHTDVVFRGADGIEERTGPVEIDFARLRDLDSLVANPPGSIDHAMSFLNKLDSIGVFHLLHGLSKPPSQGEPSPKSEPTSPSGLSARRFWAVVGRWWKTAAKS